MKSFLSIVVIAFSLTAVAEAKLANESVITVKQFYTGTEQQPLDREKAELQAMDMCHARGFSVAEKLGEEKQFCDRYTGWYECFYHRVEQQYQCHDE
ncbi:YecR family lipoprotein [Methylophaga sp. OBS1]|uniref:YecR family lipoprotein n=1 Tax=Methylophaga sp. OBS1 TaxID=2991933 RepID=UPI0022554700|nr:YecR family lipoprotein [Methylophaga sp. OBS1]MCX4192284.1 YecR family lipoprotein [Methylophaga sp. OBS1]